jgi:hypothetical protein
MMQLLPMMTVVRNVAIRHDQAIVAHNRAPSVFGTAMDGYEFPDGGSITNHNSCFFFFKLKILRCCCDDRAREDAAVFTDPCAFHDGDIASDPGPFANLHILVDHGKRIYLYIGGQLGIGMDIRMWMNHADV